MKTFLRTLAANVAGLLVLFVLLVAVELFSSVVHPLPKNFGGTKEEMCLHVARYPQWVLASVVPLWAFAAFAGAWTARRIGNPFSAALVSLLTFAALVANIAMLPYPLWFKAATLIVIPCALLVGSQPWPRQEEGASATALQSTAD